MSNDRVKEDTYKARAIIDSVKLGTSSKGTDQASIDFVVPELNHRVFTVFFYFSPGALPFATQKLRACGWDGVDWIGFNGVDHNEIDLVIRYEKYEGVDRIKCDVLTEGTGRVEMKNTMDDRQKRAFAARMANLAGRTAPAPPPPSADDEPIPDFFNDPNDGENPAEQ